MEETGLLLWKIVFCSIGLGYLTYGRRQGALVPLIAGIALFLVPFFIPTFLPLLGACAALMALPYFFRY